MAGTFLWNFKTICFKAIYPNKYHFISLSLDEEVSESVNIYRNEMKSHGKQEK